MRTVTPVPTTATPPPTMTPSPAETSIPPSATAQPTIAPVQGTTATQVNVRSEPSTAGDVLGIIPAGTIVEIVGKDPAGNWWQILYPQGLEGKGWVTAQFVTAADGSVVPVVGGADGLDPGNGSVAVAQEQINVRSGPGTGFNSLGTLNPQDVVRLTGKDASGTWLQIAFAAGPQGTGWVNAGFVQAQGVEDLPIVTDSGQVVGTGTPTGIPPTPSPTLVPAPLDNDTSANPIVNIPLSQSGTHSLIYSGDVSSPQGDTEDWIQFVPFSSQVRLEISCVGSEPLVEVTQNGQTQSTNLACDSQQVVDVEQGQAVQVHVRARQEDAQNYASYTLKVISIP